MITGKGKSIEISPDDREVLKILAELNNEFGHVDTKEIFNDNILKKYIKQAKIFLQKIELYEKTIDNIMRKVSDFDNFNFSINKEFSIYMAYVKKATEFVYEFREWVTKEEIQFIIQFEDSNRNLQYAQLKIQDLIPLLNIYLQKGKRVGLKTSKTRLQISNRVMQKVKSEFLLSNEAIIRLGSATREISPLAKKEKGMGVGRIFETVLENIVEAEPNFTEGMFKWTALDRIPGLRKGDISADIVKKLIQKGILSGDMDKAFEASLKTVGNINSRMYTEVQNVNQIKYELFNIIATSYKGGDIQKELENLFKNEKVGPAKAKKILAEDLEISLNDGLYEGLEKYLTKIEF